MRTTLTGLGGQFEIPGLKPGPYSIEVEATGFAVARHDLRLEVGQSVQLDLSLALGEKSTSIEVAARAEILKTRGREPGRSSGGQIRRQTSR